MDLQRILTQTPRAPDLLRQAPPKKERLPASFWKTVALDVLAILSGGFLGWAYSSFLGSRTPLWVAAIGVFFFLIFSFFGTLLVPGIWRRVLVMILQVLAFLAFFFFLPWKFVLGAGAVLFFFLLWGEAV